MTPKQMRARKLSIAVFSVFILSLGIHSQDFCGSHEVYLEMMKNDPEFKKRQEESRKLSSTRSSVQGLITIPVVVHVVYNNASENISDEQIYSQLDVLNEDFQNKILPPLMWNEVAENPQMEFCLATRDYYGNATCGITRTYTDSTEFRIQTSVKDESSGGISGWPATDYLNFFICDIANLRGYATFPDAEDSIDGIVVDYLSVGRGEMFTFTSPRFDQGRTATHEVGHWLRLQHIWGDGGCDIDDEIDDTPLCAAPNFGCQVGSSACISGTTNMVQNYMDYSDDSCMNLFTKEQVNLMRKAFDVNGSRVSILSSKGCQEPSENEIIFTLHFDEFPQDISWELKVGSGMVLASDGNFDPGDEVNNIPPPLANKSKAYPMDIPDGNYTLTLYDNFDDGFPSGGYNITTIYNENVVSGPGTFTSELNIPFSVINSKYRFLGSLDKDWYNPRNWNKQSVPSDCYDDEIIIETECELDNLIIDQPKVVRIVGGSKLTVRK